MLKRKITQKLLEWKNEKNKQCLLVRGARQVGKTYIIEDFAKKNYKSYIFISFYLMSAAQAVHRVSDAHFLPLLIH